MQTTLYARAKTGKIKSVEISLSEDNKTITRLTGYIDGAKITHTNKVSAPKQKRNQEQQAELEFNSLVNKAKDKGYKDLGDLYIDLQDYLTPENLAALLMERLPATNTDANGNVKPMLATDFGKIKKPDYPYIAQAKFNGVRCQMFLNADGTDVDSLSREGKSYNGPTTLIRQQLLPILQQYPDIVLDGEMYAHGETLGKTSGSMRKQEFIPERHGHYEYRVYDLSIEDTTQRDRLSQLMDFFAKHGEELTKVIPVEMTWVNNVDEVKSLHDAYVNEGFEGLILRHPEGLYGFGTRSRQLIKYKNFIEEEFVIRDYIIGERGTEDMVFVCWSDLAQDTFKVKPIGTREVKEDFCENFAEIVGKKLTVRYFELTDKNKPHHGTGVAIRDYE